MLVNEMHQFNFQYRLKLGVLQPTSYCNLNCVYCYLPDRRIAQRMSFGVLDNAIRKVVGSPLTSSRLILLWHAGEPLVVGLPFYEHAASLINRYKLDATRVEQSVQTNATLLTDAWCRFLRRERFHIGVSLDGPQFLHDKHRRDWADRGSFQQAMAGVTKLRDHGIEFGVIAVLTAASLPYADEIYDFFKSIGPASVGFNVEEIENVHASSTFSTAADFPKMRAAYYRFFARLMERVQADPEPLRIREIEQLLKAVVRIRNNAEYVYEPLEASPFRMITILHNGDVMPFSPEFAGVRSELYHNFKVGNICDQSIEQIAYAVDTSLLKAHAQASRDTCQRKCNYFQMCGGHTFPTNGLRTAVCSRTKRWLVDFTLKPSSTHSWTTSKPDREFAIKFPSGHCGSCRHSARSPLAHRFYK
jgi:uncharacterized protein